MQPTEPQVPQTIRGPLAGVVSDDASASKTKQKHEWTVQILPRADRIPSEAVMHAVVMV